MTERPELDQPVDEGRSRGSRLLWGTDRWTGRPLTALTVLAGVLAWVIVSAAYGFPSRWERVFQTLVAAVTVVMVFVIQHTQARHQAATQRKLDEILRVLPEADNSLVALEHASDQELRDTHRQHQQIRRAALEEQAAMADQAAGSSQLAVPPRPSGGSRYRAEPAGLGGRSRRLGGRV